MKKLIILFFLQLSTFGCLVAQEIDSTAIQYFKLLNLEANEGVFIGCGSTESGYFAVGSSATNQGVKYLSLKTYSLEGLLLADFSLDNELQGYKQVDYGRCMVQLSETDWILAYSREENNNTRHIRVIRFNMDGEVLWQTDLGGTYWDKARQLIVTNQSNIALVGETNVNNSVKKGYTALVNGDNGDIVWERIEDNLPSNANSNNTNIVEINSCFILSGSKQVDGVYTAVARTISKVDGSIITEKVYTETDGCRFLIYSIPYNNSLYFSTCNAENEIYIRGRVDTSLNILTATEYPFAETKLPPSIKPIIYEDGSFVSLHEYYTVTEQGLRTQIEMFGLDPEGELSFVTKISTDSTKEVYVRDLRKTPDGGYLIAGYEHFPSPQRGWLIKTDSLGNCCEAPNCDSIGYVIDTLFTSNFDITTTRAGLQVFPNPTQKNSLVNIVLNDSHDAIESSQIFSIDGKELFFSANDNANQVSTSNLVTGIYMLKLRTRKGVVYSRRLVVK